MDGSPDARKRASGALRAILKAFPVPNGRDLGGCFAEYNADYSDPSTLNATSLRDDQVVTNVSDRGNFIAPYYGDEALGGLKLLARKEQKRQAKEERGVCPPVAALQTEDGGWGVPQHSN
jgi:hypothetical protein